MLEIDIVDRRPRNVLTHLICLKNLVLHLLNDPVHQTSGSSDTSAKERDRRFLPRERSVTVGFFDNVKLRVRSLSKELLQAAEYADKLGWSPSSERPNATNLSEKPHYTSFERPGAFKFADQKLIDRRSRSSDRSNTTDFTEKCRPRFHERFDTTDLAEKRWPRFIE